MEESVAATNTCSVATAREYHGPGRYPCSPNDARRAGCRAIGPPLPPSQILSQGSFGLRVTYQDGIPVEESCGAAETARPSSAAAALRGVRMNSNTTSLNSVRTGGDGCRSCRRCRRCCRCCCCGLQACSSHRLCILIPPLLALCIAVRCSQSRRPPTSASTCTESDWAQYATESPRKRPNVTGGWRNIWLLALE